jgi:hypothetical protein
MCNFFNEHYHVSPEYIWGIGMLAGFKLCIIVRRDPCMICPDLDCDVRGGNYSDNYITIQDKPKEIPQAEWERLDRMGMHYDYHNYFKKIRKSKSVSMKISLSSNQTKQANAEEERKMFTAIKLSNVWYINEDVDLSDQDDVDRIEYDASQDNIVSVFYELEDFIEHHKLERGDYVIVPKEAP